MVGLEYLQSLDKMPNKLSSLLTTRFDISSIKWSKKTMYMDISVVSRVVYRIIHSVHLYYIHNRFNHGTYRGALTYKFFLSSLCIGTCLLRNSVATPLINNVANVQVCTCICYLHLSCQSYSPLSWKRYSTKKKFAY